MVLESSSTAVLVRCLSYCLSGDMRPIMDVSLMTLGVYQRL